MNKYEEMLELMKKNDELEKQFWNKLFYEAFTEGSNMKKT